MSIARDASRSCRVTCMSALLGAGSPLGWLWAHITADAPDRYGFAENFARMDEAARGCPRGRLVAAHEAILPV